MFEVARHPLASNSMQAGADGGKARGKSLQASSFPLKLCYKQQPHGAKNGWALATSSRYKKQKTEHVVQYSQGVQTAAEERLCIWLKIALSSQRLQQWQDYHFDSIQSFSRGKYGCCQQIRAGRFLSTGAFCLFCMFSLSPSLPFFLSNDIHFGAGLFFCLSACIL